MLPRLVIVGAGGHGKSVAEAVIASGNYSVVGFFDDAASVVSSVWQWPVVGSTDALGSHRDIADFAVVAVGRNSVRERLHAVVRGAGFRLTTVIHPRAVISPSAVVGDGCTIMAGSVVGTEVVLGEGVIVNSGAVLDHHCAVGDFGHLGTNSSMAGGSVLGRGAWMQAGSALAYSVVVPDYEEIPAGAARTVKREAAKL